MTLGQFRMTAFFHYEVMRNDLVYKYFIKEVSNCLGRVLFFKLLVKTVRHPNMTIFFPGVLDQKLVDQNLSRFSFVSQNHSKRPM